jgi:plasmid maintenance system killer protein
LDINFKNRKLAEEYNDFNLLKKRRGERQAKLIARRLDEVRAADTLEDMRYLPAARCHELKANLAGKLSLDLDGQYRLIIEPAHDPIPRKLDGGLDWTKVTAVVVLEIRDTHE